MTMTIKQFCDKYGACREGREWALNCGAKDMADLWKREDLRWEWRLWIAKRAGVMPRNDLLRFACWSVRQVWPLLSDPRSRAAIETVERFAEGKATLAEVEEARIAATAAYAYVASDADAYAAYAAAARDARAAQSQWLRENTTPNFGDQEEPEG